MIPTTAIGILGVWVMMGSAIYASSANTNPNTPLFLPATICAVLTMMLTMTKRRVELDTAEAVLVAALAVCVVLGVWKLPRSMLSNSFWTGVGFLVFMVVAPRVREANSPPLTT